jgi:hypothetical protein
MLIRNDVKARYDTTVTWRQGIRAPQSGDNPTETSGSKHLHLDFTATYLTPPSLALSISFVVRLVRQQYNCTGKSRHVPDGTLPIVRLALCGSAFGPRHTQNRSAVRAIKYGQLAAAVTTIGLV